MYHFILKTWTICWGVKKETATMNGIWGKNKFSKKWVVKFWQETLCLREGQEELKDRQGCKTRPHPKNPKQFLDLMKAVSPSFWLSLSVCLSLFISLFFPPFFSNPACMHPPTHPFIHSSNEYLWWAKNYLYSYNNKEDWKYNFKRNEVHYNLIRNSLRKHLKLNN